MKKLATLLALLTCLGSALAQEPLPEPIGAIADTAIAGQHLERSISHNEQGRFAQALEEALQARAIYQTQLGAKTLEYARATYQVGVTHYFMRSITVAITLLRECLHCVQEI